MSKLENDVVTTQAPLFYDQYVDDIFTTNQEQTPGIYELLSQKYQFHSRRKPDPFSWHRATFHQKLIFNFSVQKTR